MAKKKKRRTQQSDQPVLASVPEEKSPTWLVTTLWYAAGIIGFWSCGFTIMRGSDLYWHLATGRWIFENRAIPFNDPWSFTAEGARWVVDAWLADFLFFVWSKLFTTYGIVWWKWLLIIGFFTIMMRLLQRMWGSWPAAWTAALAAAITAAPFLDIRPQLWSMFCFSLLLELTLAREKPSPWIVPLFLVWTNLHAGFTLGILTLPALLFPYFLKADQRKRTIILGAAAVLICLINPNTYHSFAQPIIYALDGDSPFQTIGEWLPPFRPGGIQSAWYPWMIGVFIVASMFRIASRERPIPWILLGLGYLTLAMSLQSRRFVPFFAITMTLVVAPLIRDLLNPLLRRLPPLVPAIASLAIAVTLIWPYPIKSYAFHFLMAEYTFPVETLNFVEKNQLSGKVFGYFNWGGYIHLRTDGDFKVFIDGRASALFSEQTYLDYVKVLGRSPGWMGVIDYSGADYFFWPRNQVAQAQELLQSGNWKVVTADSVSVLLARADLILPPFQETDESAYKSLTRGVLAMEQGNLAAAETELRKTLEQMPWEGRACDWLARSVGLQDRLEEANQILDECDAVFPMDTRRQMFEQAITSAAANRSRRP